MRALLLVVLTIVARSTFAADAEFSLRCENDFKKDYPRVSVNVWQGADKAEATGSLVASDHGPFGHLICNDVRKHLAKDGEATCTGLWSDWEWDGDAPGKQIDTPVTVNFKKTETKVTVSFLLPKSWGLQPTEATCIRGN